MSPLPDATHIAHAHLRVKDAKRAEMFYADRLGFREVWREGSTVALSPTGQLPFQIALTESPQAQPRPPGTTGLFHIAIRFPDRSELSKVLLRLVEGGYPIQGAADHAVSEAIYLADPEGNGIELYRDRPREQWQTRNNEIVMVTDPLDVEDLLKEAEGKTWSGIHAQTDIGHIHLNVRSLEDAEKFYQGTIGFDVTTKSYPDALFVAAGGYHHHLGLNLWAGRNAPPPPENSMGLMSYGIAVPRSGWNELKERLVKEGIDYESDSVDESLKLRDPDGIAIELIPVDLKMTLALLPQRLSIARLPTTEDIPSWATQSPFFSITRTRDELSIVAMQEIIPANIRQEKGWRALKIRGLISFSEVGVLNSLTKPLVDAGISIFAISTFDTDYVLVKEENLSRAIDALSSAGHAIAQ